MVIGPLTPASLSSALGLRHVALRDRHALLIVGMLRIDPLVARHELAIERHLVDRVAIERQLEGLAHPRVLGQRCAGGRPVIEIDADAEIAELDRGHELDLGDRADGLDVGGQRPFDQLQRARAQIGQAHRGVGDRQVDDPVDVHVVLVPVAIELLDDDAVLLHALDELVRPGADRVIAELVAGLLRRLGRHHHAGAVGELGKQRRERRFEVQLDGQRIDHVDAGHLRQLGPAERALHGHVPLEAELRRRGVELLAVVEHHVGAQLDDHRLAVGRGLVAQRQLVYRRGWRRCRRACRTATRRRCARHRCAPASDRASGSSARPMRNVVWACAAPAMPSAKAAMAMVLRRLMTPLPLLPSTTWRVGRDDAPGLPRPATQETRRQITSSARRTKAA